MRKTSSKLVAVLAGLMLGATLTATAAEPAGTAKTATATAVFAGGCFWCMEPPYDALPGVAATTSGYSGGQTANPTYREVSAGTTGHIEVIQVTYDPKQISYEKLLEVFWRNVDPPELVLSNCAQNADVPLAQPTLAEATGPIVPSGTAGTAPFHP